MASLMSTWLSNCVQQNPEGVTAIHGTKRITWKELNDRVNSLANALWDLGVRKGDKVVFMFHNCPEFLESNYAIQKIGAIPVPMNFRFTFREIEYQANHSDSTVFMFEDLWLPAVSQARPNLGGIKHFICSGETAPDTLDYEELMSGYPSTEPPEVEVIPDDTCVICYTGGTTGIPKGAVLTYDNHLQLLSNMVSSLPYLIAQTKMPPETIAKAAELLPIPGIADLKSSSPVQLLFQLLPQFQPLIAEVVNFPRLKEILAEFITPLIGTPMILTMIRRVAPNLELKILMPSFPFFHDAAYQLVVFHPLLGIDTMLLPASIHFDPKEVMEMIEREKPLMLGNVPTGWRRLVDFPDVDKYDRSSVMLLATGAGLCPGDLKKRMLVLFPGAIIVDVFGQTEMTPDTTIRVDTQVEGIKDRSGGKPIIEVRIVNEKGEEIKPGEIGEITYRSPTMMKGYYKEEEKTQEVIKEGWFYSGDLGYLDEEGEIHVVERKAECISSGGEKIYPHEVEDVIRQNLKVEEVCVIGVPDPEWGESVQAVVKLKEGETATQEEISEWCKGKVAGYKRPKSVVFVDSLPLTPAGKVLRREVKEKYGRRET